MMTWFILTIPQTIICKEKETEREIEEVTFKTTDGKA